MSLIAAKVLSNPTRRAWAQVCDLVPDQEDVSLGHLLAAVSLGTENDQILPDGGITQVGRQLLTALRDVYFDRSSDVSPFQRICDAVSKVASTFSQFAPDITACVVWDRYIYFTLSGRGQIWLLRGGRAAKLIADAPLSGKITGDEIFLLGTGGFFDCLADYSILDEVAQREASPAEIADFLSPLIHRKDNPLSSAVVIRTRPETQAPAGKQTPKVAVSLIKKSFLKFAQRLPERNVYIRQEGRGKKTALSVGIILLVVLSASIVLGLRQRRIQEHKSSYEGKFLRAQTLYTDSLAQKDVDVAGAREKFREAKAIAESLLAEGIKDKDVVSLAESINKQEIDILGKVNASATLFLDLALVRENVEGAEVAHHSDQLVVLDRGGQRVFLVSQNSKKTSTVGGEGKTPRPVSSALYDGRALILAESGIVEIDQKGSPRVVVEKDDEWGNVFKIGVFGANLYLLSKDGAIWRHPATSAGFAQKQEWLARDVKPDFSRAVDWAIDGSIWVLGQDGAIFKFTRGAQDNFRVSQVEGGLAEASAIYTNDELDSLFVLEKDRGRIVELGKDGKYKLQYISEDIKQAEDFVVSASAKKIFLLTRSKILEIPLK